MTPLRQQMIAALHISGKSERTQASYIREVRLLAQFYRQSDVATLFRTHGNKDIIQRMRCVR
jgi:hypothetical protein